MSFFRREMMFFLACIVCWMGMETMREASPATLLGKQMQKERSLAGQDRSSVSNEAHHNKSKRDWFKNA